MSLLGLTVFIEKRAELRVASLRCRFILERSTTASYMKANIFDPFILPTDGLSKKRLCAGLTFPTHLAGNDMLN